MSGIESLKSDLRLVDDDPCGPCPAPCLRLSAASTEKLCLNKVVDMVVVGELGERGVTALILDKTVDNATHRAAVSYVTTQALQTS